MSKSLSRASPHVPFGTRTLSGNASALVTRVLNGSTTVLSSPALANSVGWIVRQGRCFPGFVPTLGSRSTTYRCHCVGITAQALQPGVGTELGINDTARRRGDRYSPAPALRPRLPVGVTLEERHGGPDDIHFVPDPQPLLQTLNALVVIVLNHQRLAHILLRIYSQAYQEPPNGGNRGG